MDEEVLVLQWFRQLPKAYRWVVTFALKAGLTAGALYILFTSLTEGEDSLWAQVIHLVSNLDWWHFFVFALIGQAVKMIGILASMLRWHVLLIGQGIRFNFHHIFGAFLIGRFFGTFLPGTIGLDSYKLYDAARFSKRVAQATAATVVEKIMGLGGIFLSFLVAVPFGVAILADLFGDNSGRVIGLTVGVSLTVVAGMFVVLFRPAILEFGLKLVPSFGRTRVTRFIAELSSSATAYRGKAKTLLSAIFLSFIVHFATAAMYFFMAVALGAVAANFWEICLASSIQIFGTVLVPTIAGEGVRELLQAWLTQIRVGTSVAVVSSMLGFWLAEAITIPIGIVYWWTRRDYEPDTMHLENDSSEASAEDSPPAVMARSAAGA